jgi:polyketide cyclase/dehydrase/lipid transport protein
MARTAHAAALVSLAPEAALKLWTDVRRWPTFVEGFAHAVEVSDDWPAEGSKLVWQSIPGGRGRVTEQVVLSGPGRFATRVYEEALRGEQAVRTAEDAEGTRIELTLDYELSKYGPLQALADFLFIRRALRDALRRTLRRFVVEAEEEQGLR